ncbi:hypothetical protein MMC30_006941 [Trapelia coarctata]|nr:hypothetical protein [Trapelia coarctata]
MSTPSPFSSLASKPPQNPSSTDPPQTSASSSRPPPLRSPSSNNYAAALADAKLRAAQSPTSPGIYKPLGRLGSASTPAAPAPGSTSTGALSTATASADPPTASNTLSPSQQSPTSTTSNPLPSQPQPTPTPHHTKENHHTQPAVLTTSTGKPTGTITPPAGMMVDGATEGATQGEGRPGVERMQSWSEQDMKRVMQERLLRGGGGGFSRG